MGETFENRAGICMQLVTCSPDRYMQYTLYKMPSNFFWKASWSTSHDSGTPLDSCQPGLQSWSSVHRDQAHRVLDQWSLLQLRARKQPHTLVHFVYILSRTGHTNTLAWRATPPQLCLLCMSLCMRARFVNDTELFFLLKVKEDFKEWS